MLDIGTQATFKRV